mmetsp:Transcript_69326/g.224111  ORF Transcript_69326/g.224111 Transcript_69326/m.224111 type:complete len:343 (-) Transcript_69326:211-1239(-)
MDAWNGGGSIMWYNCSGEGVSVTHMPRGGVFKAELGGLGAGRVRGGVRGLPGSGGGVGQRADSAPLPASPWAEGLLALPVMLPSSPCVSPPASCCACSNASGAPGDEGGTSVACGPSGRTAAAVKAKPGVLSVEAGSGSIVRSRGASTGGGVISSGPSGRTAANGGGVVESSDSGWDGGWTNGSMAGRCGVIGCGNRSASPTRGQNGTAAAKPGSCSAKRSCTMPAASGGAPTQASKPPCVPLLAPMRVECRRGVRPVASGRWAACSGDASSGWPSTAWGRGAATWQGRCEAPLAQGAASNSCSRRRHSPRARSNWRLETRWRGSGVRGCVSSRCSAGTSVR